MYKAAGRFFNANRKRPNTRMTAWDGIVVPGKAKKNGRPRKAVILPALTAIRPKQKPGRPARDTRVYVVELACLSAPISFIKIGASSTTLTTRFQQDRERYRFTTIAESARMSKEDALIVEAALHEALLLYRYRPPVPLVSGNTECYQMPNDRRQWVIAVIDAVRRAKGPDNNPSVPMGGGVTERKSGGFYRQPVGKVKAPKHKHGTSRRYSSGCRCPGCSRAYRLWIESRKRVERD